MSVDNVTVLEAGRSGVETIVEDEGGVVSVQSVGVIVDRGWVKWEGAVKGNVNQDPIA